MGIEKPATIFVAGFFILGNLLGDRLIYSDQQAVSSYGSKLTELVSRSVCRL